MVGAEELFQIICCQCSPWSLGQHCCYQHNHCPSCDLSHIFSSSQKEKLHPILLHTTGVLTQELWRLAVADQGITIPNCQPNWKRAPLSNDRRGSIVSPWPLQLTAPGLALNHLQCSFQLRFWAFYCSGWSAGRSVDFAEWEERQEIVSFWTARFAAAHMQNCWRQ